MNKLRENLDILFNNPLIFNFKNPSQVFFVGKILTSQLKAARIRKKWKEKGIISPQILFLSITGECNLQCRGCFDRALHKKSCSELSSDKLNEIVNEANHLGISIIVISGGEPFMRPEIFEIIEKFPEILFIIFTNGQLIDNEIMSKLKNQKNIMLLISLEGDKEDTDGMRGEKVYENLEKTFKKLKESGIFFGLSFTLRRHSFDKIMNENFLKKFMDKGAKFFLFVEYIAFEKGTENWILTREQQDKMSGLISSFIKKAIWAYNIPGDEEKNGGCLSAQGKLININSDGSMSPCPFRPISELNINGMSLKEALQSDFLKKFRENHSGKVCRMSEKDRNIYIL